MLDDLNKKIKIATVYETIKKCKKHKIKVSGSFIVGHPNESYEDVSKTRKMIRKLKLDSIGIAIATPFPGTKWWEIAKERNLIPSDIKWEDFNFDKIPIKLCEKLTYTEIKKIQRSYYIDAAMANPGYLCKIISTVLANPETFKKRIKSIMGAK